MRGRPEARFCVDFQVFLSWQQNGTIQRASGRCVDLSASGAKLETLDCLEPRGMVVVHSEVFGRMGNATIRYCQRDGMKYSVGLQFNMAFGLGDPVRRKMVNGVLRVES